MQLAPVERQQVRGKQVRVDARQQCGEAALVGRRNHQHAGTRLGRKLAVVEIVAIQGHERAAELARQAVMLGVARAPQIGLLHHEQHIPAQLLAHEGHDARGHVGIGVDPRPIRDGLREGPELRPERSHVDDRFALS